MPIGLLVFLSSFTSFEYCNLNAVIVFKILPVLTFPLMLLVFVWMNVVMMVLVQMMKYVALMDVVMYAQVLLERV